MRRGDDNVDVVIETRASTTSGAGAAAALDNLVRFPAFASILLLLSIATSSTVIILVYIGNAMLFKCVAFLLLACSTCAFTHLTINALTFFVERFFVLKMNEALYFIFALKNTLDVFFCSSSILFSWFLLMKPADTLVIRFVTSTLATFVIATGMWILNVVFMKILDCRFRDKNFFHSMQDLISSEYILQTLLGPLRVGPNISHCNTISDQLKWIRGAFTNMLLLCTRSHTISDALANSNDEHQVEYVLSMILKNLTNTELRDIQETDLLCLMKKEDIADVLRVFEGALETKSICEASLRKWLVEVFSKRKHVVHLLNNTSNVIEQLTKYVLVNLLFLVALVWSRLMGFESSKFLVYIASNPLLLVFFFGNYCKMICEGIMLAIVMHPFDLGDHCIIDNEKLVVKEMGLINTIFLNDSNENVNYLNSVLLTKSISNLNRSSELRDSLELLVSSTTSLETLAALKLKIDELLVSKPESWRTEHCFDLKGMDNVMHIYDLQITHITNFQNYEKKKYRRSELVDKLKKLLDDLDIKKFTIQ